MSWFQVVFGGVCAIGGLTGLAAFLRAPSQNRLDKANSADVLVDAAVDVSQLQRSTIARLNRRLEAAETRADAAEQRATRAERRAERAEKNARELTKRVTELEETVAQLLARGR